MISKLAIAGILGGVAGFTFHQFLGKCEGFCPAPTTSAVPTVIGIVLGLLAVGFSKP